MRRRNTPGNIPGALLPTPSRVAEPAGHRESWLSSPRKALVTTLAAAGVGFAFLALIDPRLLMPVWLGPALTASAVALACWTRSARRTAWVSLCLACGWASAAAIQPHFFRADGIGYYVYLRSAYFDRDLQFGDEWARWGYKPRAVTVTGHMSNPYSVGPALLWSPFFVLADLYVRTTARFGWVHRADGYALPYYRSTAAGTVAVAVAGLSLLARFLHSRFSRSEAAVGLSGAVLATPAVYYILWQPSMAHGLVVGVGAAAVWAWDRARAHPSLRTWSTLGALIGLITLVRWQAAVYGLLVPLLIARTGRRTDGRHFAALLASGFLAFAPQLLAWKVLFGSFVTFPHGRAFMDWSSPYLADIILSADRGLLTWSPVVILSILGLLALVPRDRGLATAGLGVLVASAWINGSATGDPFGGDAFGARRFDMFIPFVAVGTASFAALSAVALRRFPAAGAALAVALLVSWNLGLVSLWEKRYFRDAAPLERLASGQARIVRESLERIAHLVGGETARALVYKATVGRYFFDNLEPSGTIDLGDPYTPHLSEGWSRLDSRPGWGAFRWVRYPEACFRFPIMRPRDVRLTVTGRVPARVGRNVIELGVNERVIGSATLPSEWGDAAFLVPADALHGGENSICLRVAATIPGEEVGAAVSRIHLD